MKQSAYDIGIVVHGRLIEVLSMQAFEGDPDPARLQAVVLAMKAMFDVLFEKSIDPVATLNILRGSGIVQRAMDQLRASVHCYNVDENRTRILRDIDDLQFTPVSDVCGHGEKSRRRTDRVRVEDNRLLR